MEVKGYNGVISFDGKFITITRKGFLARATIGKGEKRLPLSSVSAVQWKPAGVFMNGYIEFTIGGGNENRSRFGQATADATRNENAVIFTRAQMPDFSEFRSQIEEAIGAHHAKSGMPDSAPTALLEQLADLHKKGILTDEEYRKKKASLLERI